jgi:hypothetical protein
VTIDYWGLTGVVDPVTSQSLDRSQRAALQALVASDAVWRAKTNLFTLVGLPSERGAVAALLL